MECSCLDAEACDPHGCIDYCIKRAITHHSPSACEKTQEELLCFIKRDQKNRFSLFEMTLIRYSSQGLISKDKAQDLEWQMREALGMPVKNTISQPFGSLPKNSLE
jgi:hypothetical protein